MVVSVAGSVSVVSCLRQALWRRWVCSCQADGSRQPWLCGGRACREREESERAGGVEHGGPRKLGSSKTGVFENWGPRNDPNSRPPPKKEVYAAHARRQQHGATPDTPGPRSTQTRRSRVRGRFLDMQLAEAPPPRNHETPMDVDHEEPAPVGAVVESAHAAPAPTPCTRR